MNTKQIIQRLIGGATLGILGASMLYAAPVQTTFATPQDGAKALVDACRRDSTRTLLKIFGPSGKDIVESGDSRQDKESRKEFVQLATEKMDVKSDTATPDQAFLMIGNSGWPFPVPLVRADNRWSFDSNAGRNELVARRIGANELDAIEICRGYVDAQKAYAESHQKNGLAIYAQKIVSSTGQQDGLFWPPTAGAPSCDVPPGFAQAAEGLAASPHEPYHGYFYRVLKAQGPQARGGAVSYMTKDGIMMGGFALIARPADYGVSGVKTFIVNHDGVVYEKDLGDNTPSAAAAINDYNPDTTWQEVPQETTSL